MTTIFEKEQSTYRKRGKDYEGELDVSNITVVCSGVSSAVLGRSSEGTRAHFDLHISEIQRSDSQRDERILTTQRSAVTIMCCHRRRSS